ncbi:LADA_0H12838g1_1 [Lachancea dasiensis]|uniref:LADA_0H12838g1_1 n=1 Tax=Lachancea dasiensis TaxID=1072105 RepID=A0A1G4K405_9SACH|nr:LADA_0H12838g1_1 [Lachancea dasiensis]
MPKKRRTLGMLVVKHGLSTLASLVGGSFSIAILCRDNQQHCFNRPALIVLTCGLLANGLVQLTIPLTNSQMLRWMSIATLVVCFVSTIVYLRTLLSDISSSRLSTMDEHLVSVQTCAIVATMLFSNLLVAFDTSDRISDQKSCASEFEQQSNEMQAEKNDIQAHKTVTMKNSAQTLTPDHEYTTALTSQQNWMNKYPSTYSSSECLSVNSVLKHNLGLHHVHMQVNSPESPVLDASKPKTPSRTPRKPKIDVFARMRAMSRSAKSPPGADLAIPEDSINAHYVTRLSTIHDGSRSLVNVAHSSQNYDASSKSIRSSFLLDGQKCDNVNKALLLERDAVHRINNALLPPSLQGYEGPTSHEAAHNSTQSTPVASSGCDDVDDVLMENGLEEIPRIPEPQILTDRCPQMDGSPALFHNVSLGDWELNGQKLLENERQILRDVPQLMPSFEFQSNEELKTKDEFSFPLTKYNFESLPEGENDNADAVSALDALLKQSEGGNDLSETQNEIMNDILKQENSLAQVRRFSKDLSFKSGPHSPTKSINSIITGSAAGSIKSPSKIGSVFTNAGNSSIPNQIHHSRSNSQITTFFHTGNSANGFSHSTQSSPTKSRRLKRLSKKVSLSGISFKHEEEGGSNPHNRGNSIDFSYLHTLQNKHSPSKSVSSLSRRNSTFSPSDRNSRALSAIFTATNDKELKKSQHNLDRHLDLNNSLESDSQEGQASRPNSFSKQSDHDYPHTVMSEYDREKWTTIQNLSIV